MEPTPIPTPDAGQIAENPQPSAIHSELVAETQRILDQHPPEFRRGPGRPRKNPVAGGQMDLGQTPGEGQTMGNEASPTPIDLGSLQRTLAAVLDSVDDIIGSYIHRTTMAVCNDRHEADALVAERALNEKNRDILAEHGAKALADLGMNDKNAPMLICGVVLAGYTLNNVRVIRQLKAIARDKRPARNVE